MRKDRGGPKTGIVYILERFPGDTLNFVYNEIRGLEEAGHQVAIHSILPGKVCPVEAEDFMDRTIAIRPVSLGRLFKAWCYYLFRKPGPLLGLLLSLPFDNTQNRFRKLVKTYGHLIYAVYFAWLLRADRSHIHAHFAFKAALCALVAARLNGSTFSFTAHGSATVYPPSQYCLRSKVKSADFVVAVSEYNRQTMLDICPEAVPGKIVVNRTGIVLKEFPLRTLVLEPGLPVRIVCVATLYPVKNHEGLLRACGVLARRGIGFHLDLIGKDDMGLGSGLRALARTEGILKSIEFHGGVDHGEIAQHLGRADVCILTSFSEGIPVSLMEAMARGVAVIGPRVTGVGELIIHGRTGLLADPEQPEEIADAIESLASDAGLRRKMAAEARTHIEQEYDMTKNSRRLAGVFDRFLTEVGKRDE